MGDEEGGDGGERESRGEERREEGEDRTQNSLMARFFKVNKNLLSLTPRAKTHTLWYKHTSWSWTEDKE